MKPTVGKNPLLLAAWRSLLVIAIGVTVLRLIYTLFFSPYHLTEDEAFYWDWSRHLAWSYNTKGPGIAWAIALTTGALGDTIFAVRSVAILAACVTTLSVGWLAVRAARDVAPLISADVKRFARAAAVIGAGLVVLAPGFQVTALLSTIDSPYIACWALACVCACKALIDRSRSAWIGLGLAIGAGFLFKYTILLLALGIIVFVLANRPRLQMCERPGRWIAACGAIVALGLLPVLIWNATHDWATVRHLFDHVDVSLGSSTPTPAQAESKAWSPVYFVEFIGTQGGVLGLLIAALLVCGALWRSRPAARDLANADLAARAADLRLLHSLLIWAALPVLVFYAIIAIKQRTEGNWPMAGYISLMPLAAVWTARFATKTAHELARRSTPPARVRRWPFALWHGAIIIGVITGVGMLRLDVVRDLLNGVAPGAAKNIPLSRLIGADELAAKIDAARAELRTGVGKEPFVLVEHYGRASQMAFHLHDHPAVVCAMSYVGGRQAQQDFWPEQTPDNPAFIGRPAVVIADVDSRTGQPHRPLAYWRQFFDTLEPSPQQPGGVRGYMMIGTGFKGIPKPAR